MRPGDPVKYRGRNFLLVGINGSTAMIRDDEGETMTVLASSLR